MLSDEERQAIKGLEWSQQQMRLGNLPDYDQGHYADIRTILNLIEKQSKEIEELKDKCKELIFEKQELTSALLDSTPDDKIKAKIEEYEDYGTSIYYGLRSNGKAFHQAVRMEVKEILQSLLEKE